ncbi:MAG TPA: hypothetical protein VFB80_17940 [Pirellulaceae bacterium]|nr:hypothetical protein [Pirellulaceae bacterium]
MKHLLGILIAAAAGAAGCAGGAWLEGPSDADLPIQPPARGYPTALRPVAASISDEAATPQSAPAGPAPSTAVLPLDPNPPPAAPPKHSQLIDPRPPAPALAVVPPQYQRPPAPTAPALQALPPATPIASSLPSAAAPPQATVEPGLAPIVSASSVRAAAASSADRQPTPLQPPLAAAAVAPAATSGSVPSSEERRAEIERLRKEFTAALEADIRERQARNAKDEELPRLEQQLRLAYLLADRLDDAVAAVDSLDPPQQEAYKNLMFGLGVWLSPDEAHRTPLRSAKVLKSLREATADLSMASKLELRNLAFCEKVDSYGWYTEFPRSEFAPKQQVILYVEVENFAAEHKSAAGYETELQGRYEILDASGQIVAERELPLDKEVCRNHRRDYYLWYRIYLPDEIAPGKYRLELSIEDRKAGAKYQGRKFGEGMIEFAIR